MLIQAINYLYSYLNTQVVKTFCFKVQTRQPGNPAYPELKKSGFSALFNAF